MNEETKKLEMIQFLNEEIITILINNKIQEIKKYHSIKTTNKKLECLNKISFYYKTIQQYKNLIKKIVFIEEKENYEIKFYNSLLLEQNLMKNFIEKIYNIIKNNETKKEIIEKIEEEKKETLKLIKKIKEEGETKKC